MAARRTPSLTQGRGASRGPARPPSNVPAARAPQRGGPVMMPVLRGPQRLRDEPDQHLPRLLGIELDDVSAQYVVAGLAITPELLAPNGYLHAATLIALADTACGYGTRQLSRPHAGAVPLYATRTHRHQGLRNLGGARRKLWGCAAGTVGLGWGARCGRAVRGAHRKGTVRCGDFDGFVSGRVCARAVGPSRLRSSCC